MKILIAPDSFKGSLTAQQFCDIAERAILKVASSFIVKKVPLADGGEGTVEALIWNTKGEIKTKIVKGPLGQPVEARFGILGDGVTAVIEMASASGLPLVPKDKLNPLETTTYGTGELVKEALDLGCTTIIMGIGGSATNDGGAGMLQALGFKLLDKEDKPITWGAQGLLQLHRIETEDKDPRIKDTRFLIACDVNNPLYGPNGAAYVYGPQKGATVDTLPLLDEALRNFDKVIKKYLNREVAEVPGSGAAGGFGAGLLAFIDGNLKPGFEIIKDTINLEEIMKDKKFDLVITGEGQINYQTVNGKLPVGVANLAKKYNIPVIAFVGSIGEGADMVYQAGIDSIMSVIDRPMDLEEALDNAEDLLEKAITRFIRMVISLGR